MWGEKMNIINRILEALASLEEQGSSGVSASQISELLKIDRSNVSRYLNRLCYENRAEKLKSRPVLFRTIKSDNQTYYGSTISDNTLDGIIGAHHSLHTPIQQAKAAILYPPRGLHTLILGETGVGKSMFAEFMYSFAVESGMLRKNAPFIRFNCADYADNPQLIVSQIFGVKKGAYTGADCDKEGLIKMANNGVLFLDEVHRLPPQGQEMLFTFIDKGFFRPLGETEGHISAAVQIIAATTENPKSHLLQTFSRRIPMTIMLPSLKDRGINERYKLIEQFIREESGRVSKSIYVNRDSFASLLLYDCPGNIGQLRSDIQLSCAKAFLNYKSKKENYIIITQADLPQNVKEGFFRIQEFEEEINRILKSKGDVLQFNYKEDLSAITDVEDRNEDFYDLIEKRLESLKNEGLDNNEANQILNIDIEQHFQNYMGHLPVGKNRHEITKAIETEIMDISREVISIAGERLNKEYDDNICIALALHLQSCIQRIRSGGKIFHPKLNMVRINYYDEFFIAMEVAKMIDSRFKIETPLDEIGYIAMILASNPYKYEIEEEKKVGILVIMHGNSTADSMVQVANSLVGLEHAIGLDMPLSMKAEEMYDIAKEQVLKMDKGRGVLLLVDMGLLLSFGDMIYEETGIMVKTIGMASTSIVVEACRKAVMGRDLTEIYHSSMEMGKHKDYVSRQNGTTQKKVIISACFTGEGASERLKSIMEDKLTGLDNTEIICLNILDRLEFLSAIDYYRTKCRLLAIVGTIDVNIAGIPFVPAVDMLDGNGIGIIEGIIHEEETYTKIKKSLKEHLDIVDGENIVDDVRDAIVRVESALGKHIDSDAQKGIVLHTCFMLDKLKGGGRYTRFEGLEAFKSQYSKEMILTKKGVSGLEKKYEIAISENELAYLCKMFISNYT